MRRLRERWGVTLVEIVISLAILSLIMLTLGRFFKPLANLEVSEKEKTFATQKANQMMEELRSLMAEIDSATASTIGSLDDMDDGTNTKLVLTTARGVTNPADPLSGNAERKYVRRINIRSILNEPLAREVYVRVFTNTIPRKPLAEVMSVLRSLQGEYPPTQVFDIYVIAIDNAPGRWVSMSQIKPSFDAVLSGIRARNPGLSFREHWITRLSFGRDPFYRPEINTTFYSHEDPNGPAGRDPGDWVYTYPGFMKKGNSNNPDAAGMQDYSYFELGNFKGAKLLINGDLPNPPDPLYYRAIADQYNHAVRYPDELDIYNNQLTQQQREEVGMSLRMLLEEMNSNPNRFRNAFVVNLHGEGPAFPLLRNYSDPAKDPASAEFRNMRVVTHPQRLKYPNATDQLRLRVYSYVQPNEFIGGGDPLDDVPAVELSTITIRIDVANLAAANVSVTKIENDTNNYTRVPGILNTHFAVQSGNPWSIIKLYRSPLRHGQTGNPNRRGLHQRDRLYGLEYIPCMTQGLANDFPDIDATEAGSLLEQSPDLNPNRPKNTARWVIKINGLGPTARQYTIETRIGDSASTQLPNLSKTYVWMGIDPPYTERFQFSGDPRHMPYADVKAGDGLGPGYNVYFSTYIGSGYTGFNQTALGFAPPDFDPLGVPHDLPRYYQLLRSGLLRSGALFGHISGFSFHYVMFGGEIAADWNNGFLHGIPMRRKLYEPEQNQYCHVDEMTPYLDDPPWFAGSNPRFSKSRLHVIAQQVNNSQTRIQWTSIPWLGELYPDNQFTAQWQPMGNLAFRNGGDSFFRASFERVRDDFFVGELNVNQVNGWGAPSSWPGYNPTHFPMWWGPPAFVNGNKIGQPGTYFNHVYVEGGSPPLGDGRVWSATLTRNLLGEGGNGQEALNGTLHLPFPLIVPAKHPFRIDNEFGGPCPADNELNGPSYLLTTPPEWWNRFASERTSLEHLSVYYNHNVHTNPYCLKTSAAVIMTSGTALGSPVALLCWNSSAPEQNFGATQVGQLCIGSMLRGFMEAGLRPNPMTQRFRQLPIVQISTPTPVDDIPPTLNPVPVVWISTWSRWDGDAYTSAYTVPYPDAPGGSDPTDLDFNVKFSTDNGRNWLIADNNSTTRTPTFAGVRETGQIPTNPYPWNVSGLPTGSYIIRVEAYRRSVLTHYSHHQVRTYKKP